MYTNDTDLEDPLLPNRNEQDKFFDDRQLEKERRKADGSSVGIENS